MSYSERSKSIFNSIVINLSLLGLLRPLSHKYKFYYFYFLLCKFIFYFNGSSLDISFSASYDPGYAFLIRCLFIEYVHSSITLT